MDSIYQNLLINQTKQPNLNLNYGMSPRTQYYQQASAKQLQDYAPALSVMSEYNDNNLNHLNNLLKMNLNDKFLAQNEQLLSKTRALDDELRQRDFNDSLKLANIKRNWAKQDLENARKQQEADDLERRKAAVDRYLYEKSKEQTNNMPYIGRNFAGVQPNQKRINELTDEYNSLSNLFDISNNLDYSDKYNLDIQLEKALDENNANKQSVINELNSIMNDTSAQDFYRKTGGESYYTGQKIPQYEPAKTDKSVQNVLASMENNPLQEHYLKKNFQSGNLFNNDRMSPQQVENLKSVANFMDANGYMFLNNSYGDLPETVANNLSSLGLDVNNFEPIVTMEGDLKLVDKDTNIIYEPVVDDNGLHLETVSTPENLDMFGTMFNYLVGK